MSTTSLTTITPAPKFRLSEPTKQLLRLAASVPVLSRKMRVEVSEDGKSLRFFGKPSWLQPHPLRQEELTFDAPKFAFDMGVWSDGEQHAALWLLNVWNPGWAKAEGHRFDLFAAVGTLDSFNLNAIAEWMVNPVWP
jgi:hypothetical protein